MQTFSACFWRPQALANYAFLIALGFLSACEQKPAEPSKIPNPAPAEKLVKSPSQEVWQDVALPPPADATIDLTGKRILYIAPNNRVWLGRNPYASIDAAEEALKDLKLGDPSETGLVLMLNNDAPIETMLALKRTADDVGYTVQVTLISTDSNP